MKPLRTMCLLAALLAPRASLLAANVYCYIGPTGQTLYGRVEETAGNFIAFALTEGTGGAKGRYYATEANIVLAGLDTEGTFVLTVHAGTPSTSADDAIVAFDNAFGWTGSGSSSSGSGSTTQDTRDLEPTQFTWEFNKRADGTLESTNTLTIGPGETMRCGFKCAGTLALPSGAVLRSMTSPTSTNAAAASALKLGIDPTNAKVEVTADAEAGDGDTGYIRTTIINNQGGGPVTLLGRFKVESEPQ